VWAVGYTLSTTGEEKTLIEHWNGSAWKVQHSPSPGGSAMLTAVAAVSGSNVWAVGVSDSADGTASKTLIEHWNGSGWKVASSPSPSVYLNNLCGVAAVSGSNVWAGGTLVGPRNGTEYQGPLMEHWNGQEWKVHASAYEPTGYEYAPCAIAAPTARSAWTVGSYWYYFADRTLIEHWNGTAWKVQKTPNPAPGNNDLNVLNGVAAASTSSAWAVGWSYVNNSGQRKPLIEHWNGSAWKLQYSPTPG
jgi:hypothetical protein